MYRVEGKPQFFPIQHNLIIKMLPQTLKDFIKRQDFIKKFYL